MSQIIAGPGQGLPLPQSLYPSDYLGGTPGSMPQSIPSNRVSLAAGATMQIPAGVWNVNTGQYLVLQYLDPITGTWVMGPNAAWTGGMIYIKSDGFNYRIANLLNCPQHAVVAALGSAYVQATTTITPTPGNSTWLPIVGGRLTVINSSTISTLTAGAGYGIAPIVLIPPPPPAATNINGVGGIPATAWAGISSGTLSTVGFTNPGAGYPVAPTVVVVPTPTDPNISVGITQATVVFSLANAGAICGALCTNPGAPIADPALFTLTIAGAGSSGSLTGCSLQTVTAATVSGAGSGYGTIAALLGTVGGVPPVGSIANNGDGLGLSWRPRPAQIGFALNAAANGTMAAQNGTIYDGGLFLTLAAPAYVITGLPITATTVAVVGSTIALTMGTRPDNAILQPAA